MRRAKHADDNLFSIRCEQCGRVLIGTPSGFLACPLGHGRLIQVEATDPQPDDQLEPLPHLFAEAAAASRKAGQSDAAAEFERLAKRAWSDLPPAA